MNEALEKSIVHWKEIRDGIAYLCHGWGRYCELCKVHPHCYMCPLQETGDECNDDTSTWSKFNDAINSLDIRNSETMSTITPAQREILYPLADNMVKKLQSLR